MADVRFITPVLDTSAYADGDVLFAPVPIETILPIESGTILLQSVHVIDVSDQGAAFDLVFFEGPVTLGTLNAAVSISDADALLSLGRVQVLSGDYYDVGGARIATVGNCGVLLRGAEGASARKVLYVGGISRGTGTYAANGLALRLGFVT